MSLKLFFVHCVTGGVSVCLGKTARTAMASEPVRFLGRVQVFFQKVGIRRLFLDGRNSSPVFGWTESRRQASRQAEQVSSVFHISQYQ